MLLLLLSCVSASKKPPEVELDLLMSPIVEAELAQTLNAYGAMDAARFEAALAPEVIGYDVDLDGMIVRFSSLEEVHPYLEDVFSITKAGGGTMAWEFRSVSCQGTSVLMGCTVEADVATTFADGVRLVQPTRMSVVLRNLGEGWRWVHWHSSPAALAETPSGVSEGVEIP